MSPIDSKILTGQTESHLALSPLFNLKLHQQVITPLAELAAAAKKNGFELAVASAFRGFEAQLNIWNKKAKGEKALLDDSGKPLDFKSLSEEQIIFAILRWSALPGASRHHWGTDLDVFDKKALPKDYEIQLIPSEVAEDGMFAPFHEWLDENLMDFGFFRPYSEDMGGVSPERWHISYADVAEKYLHAYSEDLCRQTVEASSLNRKGAVLANLPRIYRSYITNITPP